MPKAAPVRRLLLTGFGAFPGVPENATGLLVPRLASLARRRWPRLAVRAEILPVDWARMPGRLETLLAESRPDLALHFGVAREARGFLVESVGRNEAIAAADAAGELHGARRLVETGPGLIARTAAADRLVQRLRRTGIPVRRSCDAGGYLCNAAFYHSLRLAAGTPTRRVVFIHVPTVLGPSGHGRQDGMRVPMALALRAGLEAIADGLEA